MVEVESALETSTGSGVDYEGALASIYSHTPSAFSSSAPSGSSTVSLEASTPRRSPTLDALLSLLSEASQPDSPSSRLTSSSQRMRIADSICALLAGTVTKIAERKAIVEGARGKEVSAALKRLAATGSDKVRLLVAECVASAHTCNLSADSRRSAQSSNGNRERFVRSSPGIHGYVDTRNISLY